MPEISEKAKQVLDYIETRVEEGFPPSVREICRDLRIKSTSTAHKYLTELRDKGFIEKGDNLNRAIRLTKQHPDGIPLLGTVTAGQPILAVEEVESYIPSVSYTHLLFSQSGYQTEHRYGASALQAGAELYHWRKHRTGY